MKKAFTLIELLAVLIILGVILAIIIPVTNGVINNSRQNAYDTQIEMLLDQALKYSVNNNLGTSNQTKSIQFQDLINNGLISELPTNPKTSEPLQGCITYSWQTSINQYKFEYSENCDIPQVTYNKMVSGHDFNTKVTAMSGFDTITRIIFESTIDEGLDLNSTIDLSLNQDNSIVGFISGNTLKVQNNGVILAHEDLGATFNADETGIEKFSMFLFMANITEINFKDNGINVFDTSNVTNMFGMFVNASSLTTLDLSNFNTSNVTNMSSMFVNASSITSLDLSSFDTSNVTDMSGMFSDVSSLTSLDLSNFNTNNVIDMSSMFSSASSLTNLNLSSFDTSNVTNMSHLFYNASSLTSLNISNLDTSNVTDMSYMFARASSLTSLDLNNFSTSNVTNMSHMFHDTTSLTNLDLSSFDTSNVTNMSYMFSFASSLTSLNLSNFNTNNVTDMSYMLERIDKLQKPIITRNQEELNRYNILSEKEECNFITVTDYNNLTEQERNDLTFTSRCYSEGSN